MRKNTRIYIFALLLFAAGIAYLCYTGFTSGSVYFLNVAEAKSVEPEALKQARLFGIVGNDKLSKTLHSLSFELADKDNANQTIPVEYKGLVPDTFKAGAEVIVEGSVNDHGTFKAKTVMTKCPSKYQKENRKS